MENLGFNGNLRAQMNYKDGERSGLWKTDENGSLINEKSSNLDLTINSPQLMI